MNWINILIGFILSVVLYTVAEFTFRALGFNDLDNGYFTAVVIMLFFQLFFAKYPHIKTKE